MSHCEPFQPGPFCQSVILWFCDATPISTFTGSSPSPTSCEENWFIRKEMHRTQGWLITA